MLRRKSFIVVGLMIGAAVASPHPTKAGDLWRNSPLNAHLRFWSAGCGAGYHAGNGWHPYGHPGLKRSQCRQPQCAWDDTPCDVAQGIRLETEVWRAQRQTRMNLYPQRRSARDDDGPESILAPTDTPTTESVLAN